MNIPRKVPWRDEATDVQDVVMQDSSGSARISLWRDFVNNEAFQLGNTLRVTNVLTEEYEGEIHLTTTSETKVEVKDSQFRQYAYRCVSMAHKIRQHTCY